MQDGPWEILGGEGELDGILIPMHYACASLPLSPGSKMLIFNADMRVQSTCVKEMRELKCVCMWERCISVLVCKCESVWKCVCMNVYAWVYVKTLY